MMDSRTAPNCESHVNCAPFQLATLQRLHAACQPIQMRFNGRLQDGFRTALCALICSRLPSAGEMSLSTCSLSTRPRNWRTCGLGAAHSSGVCSLQNSANVPASALSVLLRSSHAHRISALHQRTASAHRSNAPPLCRCQQTQPQSHQQPSRRLGHGRCKRQQTGLGVVVERG